MRARPALWAVALALLAGCFWRSRQPPFTGEPYLVVWAGDADRKNADFLAVLDANPTSPTYGKVLKTYPVRSRGNEPHRVNAEPRDDRRVFAGGLLTNRTFVFDLRQPLGARLIDVDEAGPERGLWAPHDYVSLPDGHVLAACSDRARYRGDPREVLTAPGGLLELTADGQPVREISAGDPGARHLITAPYGAAAAPDLDRLVTTNAGHGYTATTQGERLPGISVQVWRLEDLTLLATVLLDAGPRGEENLGPISVRFLHRKPFVFVSTDEGGALYGSDSVGSPTPLFKLVFDFGHGSLGGEIAITPDDRFLVEALTGLNRLATLDLDDPWMPKPVSSVRFDRDPERPEQARRGGPHGVALSRDGTRVAVSDYTVDVPGYHRDGDHRVYLVRLDPASGRLGIDAAFRDEMTGEVGVSFDRTSWPHGNTGPARPAGLLFVTPEPPGEAKKRREG